MLEIDASHDGRTFDLKAGGKVSVRLPENPTTGFRWSVVSDGGPVCRQVEDGFTPGDATAVGRGGERRWVFSADRTGSARIELVRRRGREGGPPAGTFAINLRVGS